MKETINQDTKLTPDEKKILKAQIHESWNEFPKELQDYIIETKRQKLKVMYMLQDWAKQHNHETMLNLLSRRITHCEEKLQKMEQE